MIDIMFTLSLQLLSFQALIEIRKLIVPPFRNINIYAQSICLQNFANMFAKRDGNVCKIFFCKQPNA